MQITKYVLGFASHNLQLSLVDLLQPLNLPPYPFKITDRGGRLFLFDELRKKEILITPEEWVRQHFVQYLIRQKNYPKTFIKLEGGLKLNGLQRRSDILVFNHHGKKIILVECKAPRIILNEKVFDQAANYNKIHQAPIIVVTNGLASHCAQIDLEKETYRYLEELPDYNY